MRLMKLTSVFCCLTGVAFAGGKPNDWALNLTFGDDPGAGNYRAAIGKPDDTWNLVKTGTRVVNGLRIATGMADDVLLEVSENDGGWGINDRPGIFHGYIYHNCQCVDLELTLKYVPAGLYEVLVYAHGDRPNQNAAIDISSAGTTHTGRRTLNDGSWDFRQTEWREGNQYVRYVIEVADDAPIVITSKRDGSSYSMFNAVQLRRLNVRKRGG